ncbi:hypothetical protein HYFRA_00008789 [Hymenoscyphus fraxineus]|uniref:peptidyl-tRNA hydrolase n=1 Tax=Hymenoscyphus fraxineus TaxID=746836 RepID=A0A9N9KZL0_9HELO|nr:hypothetical protein HYFRA_00008789 [Hymenoscyphus fraxineus]
MPSRRKELTLAATQENVSLDETTSKSKRQTRRQRRNCPTPAELEDDEDIQPSSPPIVAQTSIPIALLDVVQMASPIRLLVCSIGNTAPYHNTLHSAGHCVLNVLQRSLKYPSYRATKSYGKGIVSEGCPLTLWQSKSLMNVSGTGVKSAWRKFKNVVGPDNARLVILHDELELKLGAVKVRDGSSSPKGHNGLKDIAAKLPGQKYTRIGVGIGRPESRDRTAVAGYVLKKMSPMELAKIEGAWVEVAAALKKMQEESLERDGL